MAIGLRNGASVVLLVDDSRIIAALPDVVVARRMFERQSKIRDLALVPEGDLAGVTPDLIDEDPNAGLSRGGESNAH